MNFSALLYAMIYDMLILSKLQCIRLTSSLWQSTNSCGIGISLKGTES